MKTETTDRTTGTTEAQEREITNSYPQLTAEQMKARIDHYTGAKYKPVYVTEREQYIPKLDFHDEI